ncbi:MAG TPA: exosortase H-associated membrane protein, partial [Usitatibacter sp.]|nr:exosortase H-associated membrane protein [Usitatibacter sp.]
GFAPGLLTTIERAGLDLAFVTTIEVASAPGQVGVLVPEVHPLTYTYGLALFAALMLAARAPAWKMLAGAAVLLLFQGWGIAFDFLAHVGVKLGGDVSALAGLRGWRAEFTALAYQLGALVFPSLVPIVAWAAGNRPLIARLSRGLGAPRELPLPQKPGS